MGADKSLVAIGSQADSLDELLAWLVEDVVAVEEGPHDQPRPPRQAEGAERAELLRRAPGVEGHVIDGRLRRGLEQTRPAVLQGQVPAHGEGVADRHDLANLDAVGADNICFETDYPHTDTTWPNSREYVEKMVEGLDDDVVYKVLRGNAIEMLSLDRV